jgi:hypothetical protein
MSEEIELGSNEPVEWLNDDEIAQIDFQTISNAFQFNRVGSEEM